MITNLGLRDAFVVITMTGWIIWCTAIFMIFLGKRLRSYTAHKYWSLVDGHSSLAH